jgi:DNA helicase-2/ATP-dependent DNA helicase PcrA
MAISRTTNPLASQQVAAVIQDLVAQNLVEDLSQIALLTFSTRETTHGISAYTNALTNAGIPFYNPRNRIAQRDQRFQEMIGALCWILDPSGATPLPASLPRGVPEYIAATRNAFQDLIMSGSYPDLDSYVRSSQGAIQSAHIDPAKSRNYLTRTGGRRVTLSHILYKLLAHEPFATSLTDPAAGERLKALNLILSEYESLYDDGELKIETGPTGSQIEKWTLYNIQAVFIEGIHDGLNDPEDDEVSVQEGLVNVMTIHQSKGLEFEVVFVLRPDKQPFLGDTHVLEDILDPYVRWPTKPATRRPARLRAAEDAVRLFFVAYSRAKRLLILTGTQVRDWDRVLGQDGAGAALNQKSHLQRIGVHFL